MIGAAIKLLSPSINSLKKYKFHFTIPFLNEESISIPLSYNENEKKKGSKLKEEKLPKEGSYPFKPKKTKDGKIPRDRYGGFIDEKGNSWIWDNRKQE